MNSFTYDYPVRNYFGEGAMDQALEAEMGAMGKTVMLAYGGGSVKRTGVYGHVVDKLTSAGKRVVDFGGIMPNPTYEKCQEGAALAREEQVDFILAVGGGSVFDCCKVVSAQAMLDEDIETFEHADGKMPSSFIPMGCIVTLSGTGAEQNNGAVITNEDGWKKRGLNTDLCRPRFAVMDPELTFTLPAYQTASGCVDIIYHTMERYFSGPETVEPTDSMAEGLMRSMLELSRRVVRDPRDYDARAGIMWAGSLSHNSLTGCGRGGCGRIGDWASHQLEHELSGMFDVTHGAGLAAVWGAWSRYVMDAAPERFARFARAVMGVDTPGSDEAGRHPGL